MKNSYNGNARAAVIVCAVLGVLLLAALIVGIILGKQGHLTLGIGREAYSGDDSYQCDLSPVSTSGLTEKAVLDIAWLRGEVHIRVDENSDTVRFSEEGSDDKYAFCRRLDGSTLSVRYSKEKIPLFSFLTLPKKALTVTLPADFAFAEIVVNGSAVTQELAGVSAGKITVTNSSGSVKIMNCTADALRVHSASGMAEIADSRAAEMTVRSSSGNVRMHGAETDALTVRSSSGQVSLQNVTVQGNATLEMTSGRLELSSVHADGELSLKVTSGGLEVEGVTAARLRSDGVSGRQNFKNTECDTIDIDSGSGSVSYEGKARKADLKMTSGNGTLRLDGRPEEIVFNGTSGSFTLAMRDTAMPIEAYYTLKSGSASCDIPDVRRDDSRKCFSRDGEGTACRIDVGITSGNFRLTPYN